MIDGDISESVGAARLHYFFDFKDGRPNLQYQPSRGVSVSRRIREAIGDSALFRYVYSNLRFSLDNILSELSPAAAENGAKSTIGSTREHAVVDAFLGDFGTRSGIPPHCTIFLFDAERGDIYDRTYKPAAGTDTLQLKEYFFSRARQAGYHVVDMRPVFVSHYGRHRQRFDFTPVDRHWNWLGHQLAAEAAFTVLRQSPDCLQR